MWLVILFEVVLLQTYLLLTPTIFSSALLPPHIAQTQLQFRSTQEIFKDQYPGCVIPPLNQNLELGLSTF